MATVEIKVQSYALGTYEVERARPSNFGSGANLEQERAGIAAEIKDAVYRVFSAYGIDGEVVLK